MNSIKLSKLITETDAVSSTYKTDADICGISNNSADIKPGWVFVCIKGFKTDGHSYIDAAVANGAAAVMVTEDVTRDDVAVIRVADARVAMARGASAIYGHPSRALKMIGVTGTNGKTSTTHIIKTVLDMNGEKTGLIGTNKIVIGDEIIDTKRTTPESCDLHRYFAQMVEKGIKYCIMEVSSHSVDLNRVHGIRFDVGVFTNLTHDHLDFHETMENYMNAKLAMLDASEKSVINTDDAYGRKMAEKTTCKNVFTYGIETKSTYTATDVSITEKGVMYSVSAPGESFSLKAMLPGRFSVYNTLAAATACHLLGFGGEQIKRGIIIAKGAKGRAETVQIPADFRVMIDYAHTPDGLVNILTSVREFTKNRIICVFGAAGDRDAMKRPEMGRIAGELADYCVVTSDNPASEKAADIISQVEAGIRETDCEYICIEDRKTAIIHALEKASAGDIVLLAGKGHETYQIVGDKYEPFSEEKIVKDYFALV